MVKARSGSVAQPTRAPVRDTAQTTSVPASPWGVTNQVVPSSDTDTCVIGGQFLGTRSDDTSFLTRSGNVARCRSTTPAMTLSRTDAGIRAAPSEIVVW